jgi:hypothetical protein
MNVLFIRPLPLHFSTSSSCPIFNVADPAALAEDWSSHRAAASVWCSRQSRQCPPESLQVVNEKKLSRNRLADLVVKATSRQRSPRQSHLQLRYQIQRQCHRQLPSWQHQRLLRMPWLSSPNKHCKPGVNHHLATAKAAEEQDRMGTVDLPILNVMS